MSLFGRQDGKAMRPPRLPKMQELVNTFEFEEVAKLVLDGGVFATIAGGDRAGFDRMTFRPRQLVPTLDLDLTANLFGTAHLAPILVGPIAEQRRYHPDAELATIRGASAAQASVVVSGRSSVPITSLAAQSKTPLWFAAYAEDGARSQIDRAVAAGCKVVCLTAPANAGIPWKTIAALRRGLDVPVIVKGVMTPDEARVAVNDGAQGVVVSDHGAAAAKASPIDVLASIVDALSGKAVVLVDGSFRRGSDIAKALALGAQAVLVSRPAMWGLAAYGADGVQAVVELLQSDLGRNMGALGAPNLAALTRSLVRIHKR